MLELENTACVWFALGARFDVCFEACAVARYIRLHCIVGQAVFFISGDTFPTIYLTFFLQTFVWITPRAKVRSGHSWAHSLVECSEIAPTDPRLGNVALTRGNSFCKSTFVPGWTWSGCNGSRSRRWRCSKALRADETCGHLYRVCAIWHVKTRWRSAFQAVAGCRIWVEEIENMFSAATSGTRSYCKHTTCSQPTRFGKVRQKWPIPSWKCANARAQWGLVCGFADTAIVTSSLRWTKFGLTKLSKPSYE